MGKSKIVIRLATHKDRIGIKEVNEKSLPVGYDEHEWGLMIAQKRSFVISISMLIVGYLVGNKDGCIISFAVLEKYRGAGLGKKLLLMYLNEMRLLGYKKVILRVKTSNDIAHKLYDSVGFKTISVLDNYYGENIHGYLMQFDFS